MSAGDEQQVRRSAIEANSHRIPQLGYRLRNIDGVLEDIPSEKQLPPPLTPPHKGEGNTTECAATVLRQAKRITL
jgi:hypothetical protein